MAGAVSTGDREEPGRSPANTGHHGNTWRRERALAAAEVAVGENIAVLCE